MASRTTTVTVTSMSPEEMQAYMDDKVAQHARVAFKGDGDGIRFWAGIEWFIKWLRYEVSSFFATQFVKVPVVGRWASRIGVSVSEFLFTVIGTFVGFLEMVFTSKILWEKAHEAAIRSWTSNEQNGLLAQTYAYGKKMASYFLEIIMQCLERAIIAHNLVASSEEKKEINSLLEDLLKK